MKRLEDVLLSLDKDVRARLGFGQAGPLREEHRALMEGPAGTAPPAALEPDKSRVR